MPQTGQQPALSFPRSGIAAITFRRPHQGNRLQIEDLDVLDALLMQCKGNEAIHVLILCGEGKHFCTGFDLGGFSGNQVGDRFEKIANAIEDLPCVTIARLQGAAIGGGSDLALACDLRVGCVHTLIRMPAAEFGIPLYPGAIRRYVNAFGTPQAKRMILTGAALSAEELESHGVLHEIAATEALNEATLALAERLTSLPRTPLLAMKAAVTAQQQRNDGSEMLRLVLTEAYDAQTITARIVARTKE